MGFPGPVAELHLSGRCTVILSRQEGKLGILGTKSFHAYLAAAGVDAG